MSARRGFGQAAAGARAPWDPSGRPGVRLTARGGGKTAKLAEEVAAATAPAVEPDKCACGEPRNLPVDPLCRHCRARESAADMETYRRAPFGRPAGSHEASGAKTHVIQPARGPWYYEIGPLPVGEPARRCHYHAGETAIAFASKGWRGPGAFREVLIGAVCARCVNAFAQYGARPNWPLKVLI